LTENSTQNDAKFSEVAAGLWEFGDIGFDPTRKLWFIQLIDEDNRVAGVYYGNNITVTKGCAIQYQWKDQRGKPAWHVRERFFSRNVEKLTVDSSGEIKINFKADSSGNLPIIPSDFAYICYAYHLSSRGDSLAPTGFVEFFDSSGTLLKTLDNRWIIVEDVSRRTSGVFPAIRIRVERNEVEHIVVTSSSILLLGSGHVPKLMG
jgi:hypothetical protein